MVFFEDMKVSRKIGVLIFIALLGMGMIGYTGYYYLQQSAREMNLMYEERLIPVQLINEMRSIANGANSAVLDLMLTTDNQKNQEIPKQIADRGSKTDAMIVTIKKMSLDPKSKELLTKVETSRQKYRDARNAVLALAVQNKNAEAYQLYVMEVEPLAKQYIDDLRFLSEYFSQISAQMNIDNHMKFEKGTQIMIGSVVLFFVILGFSGLYIAKIITKPLTALVIACQEFAAGDFRDKPWQIVRKDEIGQVADALLSMRNTLCALLKQINESAEMLAASSEELTASADQSAQAADQVARSITGVAHGAEKQLTVTIHAARIVKQMSGNTQHVATNVNHVAGQSLQAVEKATEGNLSVNKAMQQMSHIEKTVNTSAQVVTKLGERSKEIGLIIDTIAGIAGQTNLLALNAAIEAARAGEQGRGFAVVAEEVRKLAEQSQEATKQIAALIGEIQSDTNKAVIAMNEGTREVKLGADVVNASGNAFQEIASLINKVSAQTKEISTSIEQMTIGSQKIVEAVTEIDEVSKVVAEEAQTVSAVTEEQFASTEEIASSSQALAQLAMSLRESIAKFQV